LRADEDDPTHERERSRRSTSFHGATCEGFAS
jgi:hypothetical protein